MSPQIAPVVVFNPRPTGQRVGRVGARRGKAAEKVHAGDFVVESTASLEKLRGVTTILGDLIIKDTRLQNLDALKDLNEITGNLVVANNKNLVDVSALLGPRGKPRVVVNGIFHAVRNGVAPNAFQVESHGDVVVQNDRDLAKLELLIQGGLKKIPGNLIIRGTSAKSLEMLNGLEFVDGAVEISENRHLEDVSLKTLKRAGTLAVFANSRVKTAEFPNLRAVTGWLTFIQNRQAIKARFPKLGFVGKGVLVKDNPELEEVALPQLQALGTDPYLEFFNNASLPKEESRSIIDRFRQPIRDFFRGRRFEETKTGLKFGRLPKWKGSAVRA